MKTITAFLLAALMLTGCASNTVTEVTTVVTTEATVAAEPASLAGEIAVDSSAGAEYVSRFSSVTAIALSDTGITVDGGEETDSVYTSHDIVYYQDRDTYDSGNPYGEGTDADKHTAEEADAHTVVNITAPGAYRISGSLSAGQIRVDLGSDAYDDPDAVVELILDNADITCTVAPAILFLNTYECDGNWSTDTASPDVDTSAAGANLILEGKNTVCGSYVARIYKDAEGEKKLWKQDGAIYSYMSLNVYGPGSLDLTADNEGLDTELHLTIQGSEIAIRSGNDGINTNEDGVSVTTINGGSVHIIAGLGAEGDGIDSNGYLVINGGTVVSAGNPASDAGLDSDLGSYINGGTVIALGSTMDWAESDSKQVTMNLQFASYQSSGSAIVVTKADGTIVFAYDPSEDEVLGENVRRFQGAVLSCPGLIQGETYAVYLDGTLTGEETGGVYTSVTAYEGGTQMAYTGTDVRGGMGGRGGMGPGGDMPQGGKWENGERPDFAKGEVPTLPEGETLPEGGFGGQRREDLEGFDGEKPERPDGESMPEGGPGVSIGADTTGEASTEFYMTDKVNAFSGVTAV